MADNPYWNGKVHKQAKFSDRTVAGTAKDPLNLPKTTGRKSLGPAINQP
jgi:hypothetical protein